jgi:uncharacterized protein (TIGR01777 family)
MRVLVAGGTGYLGRALLGRLQAGGHSVAALSRDPPGAERLLPPGVRAFGLRDDSELRAAVAESSAIVNLAGAPLAGRRWNAPYKEEIRASRVRTTQRLSEAIQAAGGAVRTFVSGSAVGYYGDTGDRIATESSPPGDDFLAQVAVEWEEAARPAQQTGARLVLPRIGVVLGEGGGALSKMAEPYKWFAGGPVGSGRQWLSWIGLADVTEMLRWCLENEAVSGPVNLTSPNPVTMRGFARALGKAMARPSLFPVPGFMLRAMVGEFAENLLIGQRVLPARAQALGFEWAHPRIDQALAAALPARA